MEELISAFNIFFKYNKSQYPTSCEHDVLYVLVSPEEVSSEDIVNLERLGFNIETDLNCFYSYKFGST